MGIKAHLIVKLLTTSTVPLQVPPCHPEPRMRSLLLPHNLELQLIRQPNGSSIRRLPRIHIARTAALSHESHVSCPVRVRVP